jgi:hypothetical protein
MAASFAPYGGTFLVFTDYCRPAIRLAALMGVRVIHVMTHDSIGLGEDGPTHQPVEHLAALRAIPNLLVFRPATRRDGGVLGARAALAQGHGQRRHDPCGRHRGGVARLRLGPLDRANGAFVGMTGLRRQRQGP